MSLLRVPMLWEMLERLVTSEDVYLNRRVFLKASGAIAAGGFVGGEKAHAAVSEPVLTNPSANLYQAVRNDACPVFLPMTEEVVAAHYNNFYEFWTIKEKLHELVDDFVT
jgi:hypothetical protein